MARVSTYLNFPRVTEEAFLFYRTVFGTEFSVPMVKFKDIPSSPEQPPFAEADQDLVMHVALPIVAGHILMGTDAPQSMGFPVMAGNNISINLELDTRGETETLFAALAEGGTIEMPLRDMFWGDYFGILVDRYCVRWMFNCTSKP